MSKTKKLKNQIFKKLNLKSHLKEDEIQSKYKTCNIKNKNPSQFGRQSKWKKKLGTRRWSKWTGTTTCGLKKP